MIKSLRHKPGIILVVLLFITLVGAFLRLYGHEEYLHFELDQARDAKLISAAIDAGPGELPLQGARAAGSLLRLGPASYYINYLSALLFGNTPQGMAMMVTLFSIASIPLLYFLLVRYFLPRVSLALVAIYAISPFLVLYGRFAWNPNILPFFLILGMYGLLRAVDHEESRRGMWLVISFSMLAIATQAHFVALLALAVIVPIFLLIKRPRISVGAWALALFLVVFIYSPLILNDVLTGGKNVQAFITSLTESSEDSGHNKIEHVIRTYTEYAMGYHLIITGDEATEIFRTKPLSRISIDVLCDAACRKYVVVWMADIVLLSVAGVLLLMNTWRERVHKRKDFLMLMLVWFGVGGLLFYPIAFDVAPRFFLVTIVMPFVLLGLLSQWLMKHTKWGGGILAGALLLVCIFLSGYHTLDRLGQLRVAPERVIDVPHNDRILKERGRVTLEVQQNVARFIGENHAHNDQAVFINSEPFYERSLRYLLDEMNIPNSPLKANTVYAQGIHYFVLRPQSNIRSKFQKYEPNYILGEKHEFGTLVVYRVFPRPETVTDEVKVYESDPGEYSNEQDDDADHKRYTWREAIASLSE